MSNQIDNWFSFHPATPTTGPKHDLIRQLHGDLASHIEAQVPDGPEKPEALKALRASMFWCNAGIACGPSPNVLQAAGRAEARDPFQSIRCACGKVSPGDSKFCTACGQQLPHD